MSEAKITRVMLVGLIVLVLGGCSFAPKAITTEGDAARVECGVTVSGVATDVKVCVIDVQAINPITGKNDGNWGRRIDIINSASLVGEMAKGVVGGTGAAYIQGRALIKGAEAGKCSEGSNCGTTIINDGSANAGSSSQAAVDGLKVNVQVGKPAGKPACTGSCLKGD